MKYVWAPWRAEYICGTRPRRCILCLGPRTRDRQCLVLTRSARAFVMMNRFPYTNGHVMVAPRRHVGDFEQLRDAELADMMHLVQRSMRALRRAFRPDGFNIGANLGAVAGAGVRSHVHIHVVPRFTGDTNFMPVLGDTKVISEYLADTFRRLKPLF